MQKVQIASFTDDKVFINLLDKEIERHVKEYFEKDQTNNENRILTSNKKNNKQYYSFSILNKNNVVVKDHKKIILKTFHNNTKYAEINQDQFNDIPLSERFNKRCNILQRNCFFGLKAHTQQTQRSEFKSINEEIIQSGQSKTQRNNRMEVIQERIDICKEYRYLIQFFILYLAKEQQRLKMVEEQIEKNQFVLEDLAQELEIVNSNKAIFNSVKNLDQQVYKNELNCINYRKVTQELYEFIQQIQIKYFKKQHEFISPFIQNFKNELNFMLLEYESQIQQNYIK